MRSCQCPGCGAGLSIDDDNREYAFCQYCGAKVLLDDYRSTQRVVDEARLKEAETEQMIRMRELDIEEREAAREHKNRMTAYGIAGGLAAVGAICMMAGVSIGTLLLAAGIGIAVYAHKSGEKHRAKMEEAYHLRTGAIRLTEDAADYEKRDYQSVEAAYIGLGFTNIRTVNLRDLRIGLMKKPGLVERVTINGESPSGGKWYHPNAAVVITYHGFLSGN